MSRASHLPDTGVDAEFSAWFGKSKVVDADGQPLVVHHGTKAVFERFSKDFFDVDNGRSEGPGFYFTTDRSIAESYASGGRVFDVHLSIQKPLAYDDPGFSKADLIKFILRTAELEAEVDEMEIGEGFLSNWGEVSSLGLQKAAAMAAQSLMRENEALDQVGGMIGAGVSPAVVNQALRETLGYDGYVTDGFSNAGDKGGTIYVAMEPEQIRILPRPVAEIEARLESGRKAQEFVEAVMPAAKTPRP